MLIRLVILPDVFGKRNGRWESVLGQKELIGRGMLRRYCFSQAIFRKNAQLTSVITYVKTVNSRL